MDKNEVREVRITGIWNENGHGSDESGSSPWKFIHLQSGLQTLALKLGLPVADIYDVSGSDGVVVVVVKAH
jgi:hypothetical protein